MRYPMLTLVVGAVALALKAHAATQESWQREAFAGIEAAEYRFTFQEGAPEAPNRAHDLRTRLDADGLSIVSRTKGSDAFRLDLRLQGYGSGVVEAGERAVSRRGGLTEWLANDASGLTHTLIVDRPREESRGEVELRFSLSGVGAYPEGTEGESVLFRNGAGEAVVRYGSLEAQDAVGRELPARIRLEPGALVIVVEGDGAAWPITVKGLASSPFWNVSINQVGASFGYAVFTAGDVDGDGRSDVIVGAFAYDEGQTDEGKVFVYLGTSNGLSTSPVWSAQSNQASAYLGISVGAAGDVNADGYGDVIAGAYAYDEGQTDEGAAFLWLGGPGGPGVDGTPANADWSDYGDQFSAYFGTKVARAGDVNRDGYEDIAVSAQGWDSVQLDDGAAFVYHGGPSGPAPSPSWQRIYESDNGFANFGSALSGAGDVNRDGYDDLVVGAYHDSDSLQWQGSVHLYYGSSSGLGGTAWAVYGFQGFSMLGASVAGLGDVNGDGYGDIGAGAPAYDTPPFNTDDGRVFAWFGTPTVPSQPQNWSYSSRQDGSHLGTSIAAAGDVNGDGYADVIAGADLWDAAFTDEGRAFVFHGGPAGPGGSGNTPAWWTDGGQPAAWLGIDVGPAGDVNADGYGDVIVGAFGWNDGQADSGAARVFHGGPAGTKNTPDMSPTAGQAFAEYGYAVAPAGDVNGDGYSDIVVGAPKYDNGHADEGAAFIYHGGPIGILAPAFVVEGNQDGAWLGFSVAAAGDVDGDGYGDVTVGSSLYDSGQTNEGIVYVYRGGTSGLTGARYTLEIDQAGAQLGWSVGSAGDVNGDGYADIVAGAPLWDGSQLDQGGSFFALGSPGGPGALVRVGTGVAQANAHVGHRVASAGDVNRDGYSDVLVGAPEWDGAAGGDAGRVFLHFGNGSGLGDPFATWSPEGGHANWKLGYSIGSAGDVNGDGYADVIIGVPSYTNGEPAEGGAFVYMGGPSGPTSPPAWSFASDQANAFLGDGTGVASAGDVNADGYSDVLVGASSWQEGFNDFTGKAWVFLGSATGLATTAGWSAVGTHSGAQFGFAVAPAGDVDGDGYADVLVGEWVNSDGGNTAQGRAKIYNGNGGRGRASAFVQFDSSGKRVAPLGAVGSDRMLYPAFNFGIPAGRQRMSVQIEIKPVSTPFDGTGLVEIPDIDVSGGVNGSAIAGSFSPLTTYHWRARMARGKNPAFARSPWFGMADTSRTLTDFRTPCGPLPWYRDLDGDLHGDLSVTTSACTQPAGFVAVGGDCDDTSAARYPGNPEVCDTIDNDCDSVVDDVPAPVGASNLSATKSDVVAILTWTPVPGATRYSTTRGALGTLRSSGGDFAASASFCLADQGMLATDNQLPSAGDGFWYVNRAVNCNVPGTYDEGVGSQVGSRDAEIAAGTPVCP